MTNQREPKGPSQKTVKRLFAISGNQCAFPRCKARLIHGETVVGEICHIKAAEPGGARYDENQTGTQRHAFENLILMCGTHHTVIDDDEEAYTVERLAKLKAERENAGSTVDDATSEHAANLLITQFVSSYNQSGGITAGIFNQYNLHTPSIAAIRGTPDWSIHELFYYLRPGISATSTSSIWDEVGSEVMDKLSSGQLQAWGREIRRGPTTSYLSLAPIESAYWRAARFTFVFLLDDHERDLHATQTDRSNLPDYGDLRFNRAEATRLWPHPVLGQWSCQQISLTAHYFNRLPDSVTLDCRSVTLHGPHVEHHSDALGSAQYDQLVAPGYLLVSGVDSSAVRSLSWEPQEISFADPDSQTEVSYVLTGSPDTASHGGKAKFFYAELNPVSFRSVPSEKIQQANERFGARMLNAFQIGIDAPVVLRPGPKLVLRVLPITALNNDKVVQPAAPQLLFRHFMPDGFEKCDGRSRREGWVWHQPPVPVPNRPNPVADWYSRLDWDGYVEIVQVLNDADEEGHVDLIKALPLERTIVKTLDAVAEGYQHLGMRSPVVLRFELFDVLGLRLAKSTAGYAQGFDRPIFVSDSLGLAQMEKPLGRALQPLLDNLWVAAGWSQGSPSYGRRDWEGYLNPFPYE